MAVVERTFVIDEELAVALDKICGLDKQSEYVNRLFVSLIEQKNREAIENIIWHFDDSTPKQGEKTGTELLRQLRDTHYHV
ncbi:hypothetical protein LP090_10295 [Moraxella bovis]|uniref:hypothetical protein n=1 Tax=Moraxella bovis TaxID=476 RepID=UPI002226F73D|nr:hypothetical protein [Moraxella bovis]UYZ69019.1 hypothetical protein LP122_02690 [Moraxella bovis]UYZ71393.1 hypothetical protein LP089_02745 [Moraxella bovis]UYZ72694.1 hypothetical protein LP105_09915 [Moraxella bovis]UZA14686.1 hypothetical protein LP102_02680 [Moraxella bovis]UZA26951.1 hypothetical protein LP119_10155 [Moraxella bovis]